MMKSKTFDCVEYQRKFRKVFFEQAGGDIKKLWILLKEQTDNSDFVKLFKEHLQSAQ